MSICLPLQWLPYFTAMKKVDCVLLCWPCSFAAALPTLQMHRMIHDAFSMLLVCLEHGRHQKLFLCLQLSVIISSHLDTSKSSKGINNEENQNSFLFKEKNTFTTENVIDSYPILVNDGFPTFSLFLIFYIHSISKTYISSTEPSKYI